MLFDGGVIADMQAAVVRYARSAGGLPDGVGFHGAIAFLQRDRRDPVPIGAAPRLVVDLDDPDARVLVDAIGRSGELSRDAPLAPIAPHRRPAVRRDLTAGRTLLARKRPDIAGAFDRIVRTVALFQVRGATSGSHEECIGAVWIGPADAWTAADYAVAIAHETVHQILFLEEMVHGLFVGDRQALGPDAVVSSPIRGEPRPLDVAFHAACVATVLSGLARRSAIGAIDDDADRRLDRTVGALVERRRYLTRRGDELLAALRGATHRSPDTADRIARVR